MQIQKMITIWQYGCIATLIFRMMNGLPLPTESHNIEGMMKSQDVEKWPGSVDHLTDSKNRIIIFIINCPYLDFMENTIVSMEKVGVENYAIVPLDPLAQNYSSEAFPGHVLPIPDFISDYSVSSMAAGFGSQEFKVLTSSRPRIIRAFLELGVNVFYSDVDTVWTGKSNALELFAKEEHSKDDLIVTEDDGRKNIVCSCFLYAKPTSGSLAFVQAWEKMSESCVTCKNDQVSLNQLFLKRKEDATIHNATVHIYADGNPYFPSGKAYFGSRGRDMSETLVVHNNWIKDKNTKIKRFKRHKLWHHLGRLDKLGWKASSCGVQA